MNLICSNCGRRISDIDLQWRCHCGSPFDLEYKPEISLDKIQKRSKNMWRYIDALPITNPVSYNEGYTPLIKEMINSTSVHLKLEYLFPSGSYKDRGASVLLSRARELGLNHVVEDSSGNAGAAIAAYSSKANIFCDIYVPHGASPDKLTQIQAYGAKLHIIKGSREDTAQAAIKAASEYYYASHVWNPYFLQGTKTFAYEICEQLGWQAPDTVICPVGHGTLLLGTYLGFKELEAARIIRTLPKIIGIQTDSCPPLADAWRKGNKTFSPIIKKQTIAEGISIAEPVRATQILEAVKQTDGEIISVSEEEILNALRYIHRKGYYIEPTSATAIAGLNSLNDLGEVIIPLTGSGLKATEKIRRLLENV